MKILKAALISALLGASLALVPSAAGSRHSILPRGCARAVTMRGFDSAVRRTYAGDSPVANGTRHRLLGMRRCSEPRSVKRAETRYWVAHVHAHNRRARRARFVSEYEPYYGCTTYGGCSHWAIPACMVQGESHGLRTADAGDGSGGYYGILVSTWQNPVFDGTRWTPVAPEATKDEQSIVATEVLRVEGFGAWQTAAPCGY